MPTLEEAQEKVNTAKHTTKKKKVLSEKQKAVLEKNKLKKGEQRTKKIAASGGTAKGAAYELLRELVSEAKARNNVKKIFDDLDHGDFQNALARLSVLKQSGASFDQTDEGKTQKMELDNRLSGGVDIKVTGLD